MTCPPSCLRLILTARLAAPFAALLFWAGPLVAQPQQPADPSRHLLLVDADLHLRAGAQSLLLPHDWIVRTEDRLLGIRWTDEETLRDQATGIVGRVAKLVVLDIPVDYFTVVLAHEYFGHGARYREMGLEDIDYGFDLPPPYGVGGGHASINLPGGVVSQHERLAMWTGGFEVQTELNRSIRQRWAQAGTMNYREAWIYFWSMQISMNYVQETEELLDLSDFNDPQAYVYFLNLRNGYTDPESFPFTVKDVKRLKNRDALDPFIYAGLWLQLKTYLWSGQASGELPMLRVGDMRYLPSLHIGMTPFGIETVFENYLRRGETLYLLALRRGDETFHSGWGGIGLSVTPLLLRERVSVDVALDLWQQPRLRLGGRERPRDGGLGGAATLRLHAPFGTWRTVLELGYKTAGFLEGHVLDAAPIVRVGLQL